jgi:hypothetical protein
MLRAKECTQIPSPSIVFTFGFAVESINEFGGCISKTTMFWFLMRCSLMHCKRYILMMACLVVLLQYFQIVYQWQMFLFFKDFGFVFCKLWNIW